MSKLEVKRLGKYWWVIGLMDGKEEYGPVGPYNNRKEAVEGKRGMISFERNKDKPGYITSESLRYE